VGQGEIDEQLGKGEGAAQKLDPPYRSVPSGDESAMNVPGEVGLPELLDAANFGECPFHDVRE
jgi:hypothetical protein